ncbi:MAG: COG1361 S-layer family protein [Thermoplasmatota archaeon]
MLLASALPVPTVPAQGAQAPWYGPSDATDASQGWGMRVPVIVTNDRQYDLTDWPVSVSLDLGQLLVAGGWTSQASALEQRVKGFTLDTASVRVIEYQNGFRDFLDPNPQPVPAVVYPALLDKSARGRAFDASTNPLASVTWIAKGKTAPGAQRFYYIYFQAKQYGDEPAPTFPDDRYYGLLQDVQQAGRGQIFYGQELGADSRANELDIHGLYADTHVAIYVLGTGPPQLATSEDRIPNPVPVNASEDKTFNLPEGTIFKVVATQPILLSDHGTVFTPQPGKTDRVTYGAGSFVMSQDLGWAGTSFDFPLYTPVLNFYAASTGSSSVQVFSGASLSPSSFTLSAANPLQTVTLAPGTNPSPATRVIVSVTGQPILIQYGGEHALPVEVPARDGAPWGVDHMGTTPRDSGEALLYADGPANLRIIDPAPKQGQPDGTYPVGPRITTPPDTVAGGLATLRDLTVNQSFNFPGTPQQFLSAVESKYPLPGGIPGALEVLAGPQSTASSPAPDAGYFEGPGANRMLARGPTLVAAHFNETRVQVRELLKSGAVVWTNATRSADDLLPLFPQSGSSGVFLIDATKPVTAFAASQPFFNTAPYARFIPGRLAPPPTSVGNLEFRGPLVDLTSPDAQGTEILGTPGPDQPWDFNLALTNKGHWIGGENLPDAYTIDCAGVPTGWDIFLDGHPGCDPSVESIHLDSGQTQAVKVTVVPKGATPGTVKRINVTAHSSIARNVTATLHLKVFVTVTFGVGLWLDVENGLKSTIDPIALDPGQSLTPPQKIVLKNLGSVEDTFELKHQAPAEGWSATLAATATGTDEVRTVTLGAGQSTTLFLQLKAPPQGGANFNSIEIGAQSLQSANAADKVTVLSRIRADIAFELRLAERSKLGTPGQPTAFTLALLNKGNDIVRVSLSLPPLLTPGWNASLDVAEVNLNPGVPFNVTLTVTPSLLARAGDQSSLRITGETTTGGLNETPKTDSDVATVVVKQVHLLDAPAAADIFADPGTNFTYSLPLTNHGNGDEFIELLRSSVRPPWPIGSPGGGEVSIARGDSGSLDLVVGVPPATRAASYAVNFSLRLSHEALQNFTLPVTVRESTRMVMVVPSGVRVSPGQEFPVQLTVTNVGNVNATLDPTTLAPAGWQFRFDPATLMLAPGETSTLTAFVNASRTASDGVAPVTFKLKAEPPAGSTRAPTDAGSVLANVTIARPDLAITDVSSSGSTAVGDLLVVTAGVANRGTIEAKNVEVVLMVDGNAVDRVALDRIPAGASKLATLKWSADHRASNVTVVVNPDASVVEVTPGAKSATVTFAKPIPMGTWTASLALLATALFVARRRRSSL